MGLIADVFVYGLIDPVTNEMRYIGKTRCGLTEPRGYIRIAQKLNEAQRDGRRHVLRWICSLLRKEQVPKIEIIEYCDEQQLNDLEIAWIAFFRQIGCNLANMTDGGDGGRRTKSDEERQKISLSLKGRKHSRRHRENHAAALRGKKIPAHSGENHWTAKRGYGPNTGKKFSDEYRKKLSDAHKGQVPWNKGIRGSNR